MQTPEPTPAPQRAPLNETNEQPYPPPPQNVGSDPPFSVLVGLFERLQGERKMDKRSKLIDGWFNHWRDQVGYDLYPVLRLILPQKDRERAVYGLKEKNLAKNYIKLIPLQQKDPDAVRLLNWKKPSDKDKASGDFPTVLHEVVSKRSSVIEGSLSIKDLNHSLDELSNSMGKSEIQSKILQRIYNRATANEQRWIVRIILKDMVISVKETTVFSVFHPDAQDLYNTCSDLKRVAWTLWDKTFRLKPDDKNVRLFHSFAPMLCKRPTKTIDETVQLMGNTEFFIEEKLDGERMQLHKRGNEYFYCSRKGKDYTYLYGKHVGAGSLTPFIAKAFDERVEDIILDGEMLVWDPVSQRNLPFGTLKTAALDRSKKEHNPRPCFKIFDLLHLNGESLLDKSTTFRKKNMRHCVKEITGRIEYATEYKGTSAQDIRDKMEEVMGARGEGLVIKHPRSKYVLNGRNQDWIKVKPEYLDNMGETVDVLVVAGDYGSGSRGGGVSTLICAVFDDRAGGTSLDENATYSTFVRIGSGLSFADYVWVRAKPWKPWDPKHPPAFLNTAKKGIEDKGDVYLEPEDSFILKVKAAEIVVTTQYGLGYTMRFPRALSIRDDLSYADCMTATEVLNHIRSDKKRKMETDLSGPKKKRKVTKKTPMMLTDYTGPKLKTLTVETSIFRGLKFYIAPGPDLTELTQLIYVNGGTVSQTTKNQPSILVVFGGSKIPYDLRLILDKGVNDIIKPEWVRESIAKGEQVPLTKKYFFYAKTLRQETEEYGQDDDDETQDTKPVIKDELVEPKAALPEENGVELKPKVEEEDLLLAEWFRIEPEVVEDKPVKTNDDTDSATDDDSENEDVVNPDQGVADELDDWTDLQTEMVAPTMNEAEEDVKMGEDEDAMHYDQDLIFKHLAFYLDSPANAVRHGMPIKSKYEEEINASFLTLSKLIEQNGGRIVDITDQKMTHVVVDKRDDSRRLELMRRTSKPKRRHLIIAEFIQACLDEKTLLDEEEFAP